MNLLLLGSLLVAIVGAHTVDALKVPIREEISIPLASIDECCMDPVNACQKKGGKCFDKWQSGLQYLGMCMKGRWPSRPSTPVVYCGYCYGPRCPQEEEICDLFNGQCSVYSPGQGYVKTNYICQESKNCHCWIKCKRAECDRVKKEIEASVKDIQMSKRGRRGKKGSRKGKGRGKSD